MTMKSRDQFLWINFLAKSEKFWMAILIMICGMYVAIWWCQCHTYFGILVALFRMSVWITSKKKKKREQERHSTVYCFGFDIVISQMDEFEIERMLFLCFFSSSSLAVTITLQSIILHTVCCSFLQSNDFLFPFACFGYNRIHTPLINPKTNQTIFYGNS